MEDITLTVTEYTSKAKANVAGHDLNNNPEPGLQSQPEVPEVKSAGGARGGGRKTGKKNGNYQGATQSSSSKTSAKVKKKKSASVSVSVAKKKNAVNGSGSNEFVTAAAVRLSGTKLPFEVVTANQPAPVTVSSASFPTLTDLDEEDYSTLIRKAVAVISRDGDKEKADVEQDGRRQSLQDISSLDSRDYGTRESFSFRGKRIERQNSESTLAKLGLGQKSKKLTKAGKSGTPKKRSTISIYADGTMMVFPSNATTGRRLQLSHLLTASSDSGSKLTRKAFKLARTAKDTGTIAKPKRIKLKPLLPEAAKSSSKVIVSETAIAQEQEGPSNPTTSDASNAAAASAAITSTGPGTKLKRRRAKSSAEIDVDSTATSVPLSTSKIAKIKKQKRGIAGTQSELQISVSVSAAVAGPKEKASINNIYNVTGYKVAPPAPLPKKPNMWDLSLYLTRIQNYFHVLGYQRQGEPLITVNTHASIRNLNETAKKLIKAGEPIKCLHALILSIHLTNCSLLIERFPINFKSKFNGKEFRHVVLGIYMFGRYGALGISRDPGLQSKSVDFARLSDLLDNFRAAYQQSGHELMEIKVGGGITHDPHSLAAIQWKLGSIIDYIKRPETVQADIQRISKLLRSQMGQVCLKKSQPDTGSINAGAITAEYILQHTSIQLHRSRVAPAPRKSEVVKLRPAVKKVRTAKIGSSSAVKISIAQPSTVTATTVATDVNDNAEEATITKIKKGTKKETKLAKSTLPA